MFDVLVGSRNSLLEAAPVVLVAGARAGIIVRRKRRSRGLGTRSRSGDIVSRGAPRFGSFVGLVAAPEAKRFRPGSNPSVHGPSVGGIGPPVSGAGGIGRHAEKRSNARDSRGGVGTALSGMAVELSVHLDESFAHAGKPTGPAPLVTRHLARSSGARDAHRVGRIICAHLPSPIGTHGHRNGGRRMFAGRR